MTHQQRTSRLTFPSTTRRALAALTAVALAGCVADFDDPLAEQEQEVRGGAEQNGHPGLIEIGGCTGSMIGPTLILTAAHCLPSGGSMYVDINYFEPGLDADAPRDLYNGSVDVYQHPLWTGDTSSENGTNRDLAIVRLTDEPRWPGTDYHDYLRIYQDFGSRIPGHLDLYGQGYETLNGYGLGTLRMARFEVAEVEKYRIQLHHTDTEGSCGGDSGAPYMIPGQDLITCVHSRGNHDGNYCGQDDGILDRSFGYCTRPIWSNLGVMLRDNTDVSCETFTHGSYDYWRCFDIPFVNDVDGEGLDQDLATGIVTASL